MLTYKATPILIKTKTNLHVGSGDTNYTIVDKTVQRDSISKLPIINASSLKGALRNYFVEMLEEDDQIDKQSIAFIFGKDDNNNPAQGYMKFLDSYLLFLPLRADVRAYYHVTSKENLLSFCNFFNELGFDMEDLKKEIETLKDSIVLNDQDATIEEISCNSFAVNIPNLENLFGDMNIAIFSTQNFTEVCENLPIIARNKVKTQENSDGNLWYEEVVPRESIFYTAQLDYSVYGARVEGFAKFSTADFYNKLQKEYIQVGANASIGFGLCKFDELSLPKKEA